MKPFIDRLEKRMLERLAQGRPLENNPKIPLREVRASARRLYLDGRHREREDARRGWVIERNIDA